jgi:glutaminyl-tRNA synthetase
MSEKSYLNFIEETVEKDLESGVYGKRVHTRFPPEPNGYLHIGHAKSICLNFGIAEKYNGKCNLRFDDTNPLKEDKEYVNSIIEDVKWLGFDWEDRLFYASSYFDKMYEYAQELIKKEKAYVCDLSADEIRKYRGTLTQPGKESPYRNRSVDENLELFEKMKNGAFKEGSKTLRAKIDMTHPNLNMRDPVMYRIINKSHHKTKDEWHIYPTYDWAHCLEDSIEGITHSLCTLEFADHRILYDWFLEQLDIYKPKQIEFARLNLTYTVLSKRKLTQLVDEGYVSGWDDPRMPTIAGLRRRGYTPFAIRDFVERTGITRSDAIVDYALLEHCIREDLNKKAKRVMAVLEPIKLVITNYPENKIEYLDAENNPENPDDGFRSVPFCREIYIEKEDFREDAPKKFFRLSPGKEVRLKHAYYITCNEVIKNENGEITEIRCTYDPKSKGGWSDDGRKVRGTLHWVSVKHSIDATIRLYSHLFIKDNPDDAETSFLENINKESLLELKHCKLEPLLKDAKLGENYQFLRKGYFCLDKDSKENNLIFNQTATLKDSWQKVQKK